MGTNGHAPSVPGSHWPTGVRFLHRPRADGLPLLRGGSCWLLVEAGFTELSEDESWSGALKPGGK